MIASSGKTVAWIMDFSIGQGAASQSGTFLQQVKDAQAAGIKVYGYVPTYYGCAENTTTGDCYTPAPIYSRTRAAIEGYVDQWYAWYNPDGIFYDEGSKYVVNRPFYQELYSYVKGKTNVRGNGVLLNAAGTQRYNDSTGNIFSLADIVNIWEKPCTDFNSTQTQPSWVASVPREKKMSIAINCLQADMVPTMNWLKNTEPMGYAFVTDAGAYGSLPKYWSSRTGPASPYEVDQVSSSSSSPVSQLKDSFQGPAIDSSIWSVSATAGTSAASGGTLSLTPNVGNGATGVFVTSVKSYALTNSSATINVTGTVDPAGSINNKFVLFSSYSNEFGWWFEGGKLYAYYLINNVQTFAATLTYSSVNHAWWRVRHANGTVYWETSADGSVWTIQGQVAATNLPFSLDVLNLQFNLKAWGTGATTAAPAKYANLNNARLYIPVSQATDAFPGPSVDTSKWTVSATAGTAGASNGVLTLTPNASTASAAIFVTSVQSYTLNGSQASAKVVGVVDPGGNINNKLTLTKNPASNELGWWYERGSLIGYYLVNGVQTNPVTLSYSPSTHAYWRIRASAGTVYWETSADGGTYTVQAQTPASNIGFSLDVLNLQFNLKAWGAGAATSTPARYSNLNSVPVSQVTDAFPGPSIDTSKWTVSATAGTAGAANGVLTLTPNASTASAAIFVTSVQSYMLNGSQASVKVVGVVDPGGNINNKLTLVKDPASNELGWWYERGSLLGYYLVNGVQTIPVTLSYSASTHAYWRIRSSAGTVYWETSADGGTYAVQAQRPASNIGFSLEVLNLQFNVKAWGAGAATSTPARYSNLNQ